MAGGAGRLGGPLARLFPLLGGLLLLPAAVRANCACSPFSGNINAGDCCDGGKNDTCGSWFHRATCNGSSPVCCTSDFGSACCPAGSSCSPGCRNSLEGGCGCVPAPDSLSGVGFNMTAAVHVLGLNAATQCAPSQVQAWNCVACAKNYRLENLNVTQNAGHMAFTAWDADNGKIQVVLRGSLSIKDWLSDADFPKTAAYEELGCVGCGVHEGLYKAYKALQPAVEEGVETLLGLHPGASISLTGHSLGAAMAAHAAIAFAMVRGWKLDHTVYTFGQPRVGDAQFAAWFSPKFPGWLRSVHWNDPVPHLPPTSLGSYHYRHVGRELWWTEDSKAEMVCDGTGEDPNCSASIMAALNPLDHWYYLGYDVCNCVPFKKGNSRVI